jgi:hypothetical protein
LVALPAMPLAGMAPFPAAVAVEMLKAMEVAMEN